MTEYYNDINGGENSHYGGRRIARCIQCGYSICENDDAATVNANGGAIHRGCWEEYASENPDEFLDSL